MRLLVYIFLLAFAILLPPADVRAEVDDGTVISNETIAPLMAWVEQETGIKIAYQPRVLASRTKFHEVLSRLGQYSGRPRSAYVSGMVLMDSELWDPEDSTQISLLLHELVHHAQSFTPKSAWACDNEKEAQAYSLQNKWLEEQGHYAFVQASWIKRVSACPSVPTTVASLAQQAP
ncbi:MAG: hypothetical protein PHX43_07100 [Alphaproteobacteria bacterium]|nr:hypothetical protein [Alphaproteobacteria bacterium]